MITKFDKFLNENESDDIRKRLEDRINRSFQRIRTKYPKTELGEEPVREPSRSEPVIEPKREVKPTEKRELQIKPKVKSGTDVRKKEAFSGLKSMGFDEKDIKDFLDRIIELYPETETGDIIMRGIRELSNK
jgi:hypothetical protein